MSIKTEFLVYCIEEYKRITGLSGREAYDLFEKSGAMRYILDHYDALHTAGVEYTIADIKPMMS